MNAPGPEVVVAAAVVQKYLDGQPAARVTNEQFAKMSPAERLDYAHKFDQSQYLPTGRRG